MTASSTLTVAQAEARVLAAAREWAAAAAQYSAVMAAGMPPEWARDAMFAADDAMFAAARALAVAEAAEAATAADMERAAREGGAS